MAEQLVEPNVIAKIFGFEGVRRIDQLVQDGVITPTIVKVNGRSVRRYDLVPTVTKYIGHLQEKLKGRTDKTITALEYEKQKEEADIRYKVAKAQKIELELKELKGQLHASEDVDRITDDLILNIRAAILALPGKLAVNVSECATPAEASAVIKRSCNDVLNELSKYEYDPKKYKQLVRMREKWMRENAEDEEDGEEQDARRKTNSRGKKNSK
ncbi:MAG: protoporphyrinogen oxidase [Lachnospiraceae bacterium]|nr:protoporphyrinogen oxidase [Lachnospiraceae bacterium]